MNSPGGCSELHGVSALLCKNLSDVALAPLLSPTTSCDTFSSLFNDSEYSDTTLEEYNPNSTCPPLFARNNNGYRSPPPLPPRFPAAQDSGFNSYEEDQKEDSREVRPVTSSTSLPANSARSNELSRKSSYSNGSHHEELRRLSSSTDLEELATLAKITDLKELRRLTSSVNLREKADSEKNIAKMVTVRTASSTSSSSGEFWSSDSTSEGGTTTVRFQTMHSYPGEENDSDFRRRRKCSIDVKYKRRPKVSNVLFAAANVAVKLNSPVPVETKLVKKKKDKPPKKGSKLKSALVNPLNVAVNVNTPDNANINFDAFQDYARDIHPDLPRSRQKTLVKSGLIAPLNVAVNVNTPAYVKYPINKASIPKKRRSSVTRPLPFESNPMHNPVYQRLESGTGSSTNGEDRKSCSSDSSTPKVMARTLTRSSVGSTNDDPLKKRVFGREGSVLTLSGCSESSCSSIDDISDTDDPDNKQTIKPMAAYGVRKSKSGTLTSIKSVKSNMSARVGSLKKSNRDNRRPSICDGLMGVMGVAIKVNTPADARKVCSILHSFQTLI